MKVPLSWIREFVDVKASADEIGTLMGVRGLALEGLEAQGDDVVMDFDVTANRPDCMSVIGIAREIATAYNLPLMNPAKAGLHTEEVGGAQVTIEAPDLCGRYVGCDRRRRYRTVAAVDAGSADDVRRAADQQHRRHHQLRDARDRPADARLRSREDARGQDHRRVARSPARR